MPTNTRSKAANAPKRSPKAPHLREVPKTNADQEPTKPWLSRLDDVPAIASYLRRVEATPMSLRRAVIEERTSKYHVEKYVFTFAKDGAVTVTRPNGTEIECAAPDAPPDPDQWLLPSDAEVTAIQNGVAAFRWPDAQCGIGLPGELEAKDKREGRDYFVCKTREGKTLMVHERLKTEDERGKRYRPWSYWSDRQWRPCEPGEIRHDGRVLLPDGKLPLYGLDKMGYHATVFVHEGAKAAATIQRTADCYNKALEGLGSAVDAEGREERHWALTHPYMPALAHGAHIGWISGAQQPHRVHWEPLKEALKGEASAMVYLIADNDHDGVWALPQLSRGLGGLRVLRVVFTPQFPAGFDLADNLPDWMWKKVYAKNPDGTEGEVLKDKAGREVRRFIGPPLSKLLHPATWASAIVPTGKKGRPLTVVTRAFCEMWIYVRSTQEYVCKELPSLRFLAPQLNSECSGYSDTHEVSKLLDKGARLSVPTLLYDPSREGKPRLTEDGFNIYEPPLVEVEEGSVQPFLDFMSYLFVNPEERKTVMRWVATLIARPDIKMHYGLLLVSEHQGTGKNTLGEHILAPLVASTTQGS